MKFKKYKALKDFWLNDVKIEKGTILDSPVSKHWLSIGIIAEYVSEPRSRKAEEAAKEIVENTDFIKNLTEPDVIAATDAINSTDTEDSVVDKDSEELVNNSSLYDTKRSSRRFRRHRHNGEDSMIEQKEQSEIAIDSER